MRQAVFTVLLTMVAVMVVSSAAFALKKTDMPAEEKSAMALEIYQQLPPEDQERVIEESERVFDACMDKQLFSALHDCACVAAAFFDERMFQPDPRIDAIQLAGVVSDQCPNIPGVAGYAYTQCSTNYGDIMKVDLDLFCTCYAKKYAELYKGDARAFIPHMANVGASAMLACEEDGLPTPLTQTRSPAQ